eukprot:COSAG01_NODE_17690_length_1131_cov_0.993217_2_plen_82_part_01
MAEIEAISPMAALPRSSGGVDRFSGANSSVARHECATITAQLHLVPAEKAWQTTDTRPALNATPAQVHVASNRVQALATAVK